MKTFHRVQVTFPLTSGFHDRSDQIEKAAKRQCMDSGAGMGYRDMGWNFKTEQAAINLAKRIKAKRFKGLSVTVTEERDD